MQSSPRGTFDGMTSPSLPATGVDGGYVPHAHAGTFPVGRDSQLLSSPRTSGQMHRFGSGSLPSPGNSLASFSSISRNPHATSFLIETVDCHQEGDELDLSRISESPQRTPKKRAFWLDWLRIISIYLVMSFHVTQCLSEMGLWKSGGEQVGVTNYMATSLQFGMPVFFHISGRAQAFAKPSSMRNMVVQRSIKLLVPCVVCYFLLIPQREYMFEITDICWRPTCNNTDGPGKVAQRAPWNGDEPGCKCPWSVGAPFNYFGYIGHYFTPSNYVFNIGWLWFLPTLFGISVVSGPVFQFSETRERKYLIASVVTWLVQVVGFKVMFGYYWSNMFFSVAGSMVAAGMAWYIPFPNAIGSTNPDESGYALTVGQTRNARWTANRVLSTFNMAMCIGIVSTVFYHHEDGSDFQNAAGPAWFLNIIFYQQGYYTQRWNAESLIIEGQDDIEDGPVTKFMMWRWSFQIIMFFSLFLILCMSSPIGKMEQMIYPIYSASFQDGSFFGVLHVLGTWCYIEIAVQMFRAFCDRQIHPQLYAHSSASTIIVYIFHWMFAAFFAYLVFYPLGMVDGFWKVIDPILLFAITATCSMGVYALLKRFPTAGMVFGL